MIIFITLIEENIKLLEIIANGLCDLLPVFNAIMLLRAGETTLVVTVEQEDHRGRPGTAWPVLARLKPGYWALTTE